MRQELLSKIPNYNRWLAISLIWRLCMIGYGIWHDQNLSVRFTDIDYDVYTDAARQVADGNSPYQRLTYRYTPLVAYLCLPNLWLTEIWAKVLFAISDVFIGKLTVLMLIRRGVPTSVAWRSALVWLAHPFSWTISTRGNADTLISAMVLLCLYYVMEKQLRKAAVVYGFAVHFKIYPIVYALAFLVLLDEDYNTPAKKNTPKRPWWKRLLNRNRIEFGGISASVFFALNGIFYYLYGYKFLYETYLYHFVRTDNRHNFSVYFYYLYLSFGTSKGTLVGLLSFIPQVVSLIAVSLRFGKDIFFSTFLLTMIFVTFNKVCTAQYFVWYTALLPLVLPRSTISLKLALFMTACWFAAEFHWLYWANALENQGYNTFFEIWIAGLIFFTVNISVIVTFIQTQKYSPLFQKGRLIQLE